jgi:prepilin-type N-terminal cleavage/methylation domain-containing protein
MTRARAGFTLIELLVATGVFVVGFVAVFGLFLAGIRFRKLSDDTARAAVAASSIINEIRIDAGRETVPKPCAPSLYVGNGFADAGDGEPTTNLPTDITLYAYTAQPGVYYRVLACTDLLGTDDAKATTLRLKLFVLPWISDEGASFKLETVVSRLRMTTTTTDETLAELVQRGLGFEYDASIVRNPSWR